MAHAPDRLKAQSAIGRGASPARGRQKFRRRGEDTPKAPRAFADLCPGCRDALGATRREPNERDVRSRHTEVRRPHEQKLLAGCAERPDGDARQQDNLRAGHSGSTQWCHGHGRAAGRVADEPPDHGKGGETRQEREQQEHSFPVREQQQKKHGDERPDRGPGVGDPVDESDLDDRTSEAPHEARHERIDRFAREVRQETRPAQGTHSGGVFTTDSLALSHPTLACFSCSPHGSRPWDS